MMVKYFLIGGFAALVDLCIFYLCAVLFGFNYLIVGFITFWLAFAINVYLSERYVFRRGIRFTRGREFVLLAIISIIGLCLNQAALYIGVNYFSIDKTISKIIATGSVFLWNYCWRNSYVYSANAGSLIEKYAGNFQTDIKTTYVGNNFLSDVSESLSGYNSFILNVIGAYVRRENVNNVLEFGAGIGTLAKIYNSKFGVSPDCLEIDPVQRNTLRENGFKVFGSLNECGATYDLIYSANVLEHVEDDLNVLRQLRKVINPGGLLLVYVPAFPILYSSFDINLGHYRRYTRRTLTDAVQAAGFTVVSSRYADSLGFLFSFMFKVLGYSALPSTGMLKFFDRFILPLSRILDIGLSSFFGKNVFLVAKV